MEGTPSLSFLRSGELKSACGLSERLCRCALSRGRSQNAPTNMIFYRPVKPALMQVAKLSLSVRTRHMKRVRTKCSYSFCYFFGRCCPLRVILSGVRPRFHLRFARCCFAVRLRSASLRMTRADAVETRRANGNAVRISQGD